MITALSTNKNFQQAHYYADVLIDENISKIWGYFFKGEIYWYDGRIVTGDKMFKKSMDFGMDKSVIYKRKKELIPYIKPKTEEDKNEFHFQIDEINSY
jgi:hypothetical protein